LKVSNVYVSGIQWFYLRLLQTQCQTIAMEEDLDLNLDISANVEVENDTQVNVQCIQSLVSVFRLG
jgi:hypothetical protein